MRCMLRQGFSHPGQRMTFYGVHDLIRHELLELQERVLIASLPR